MALPPFTTLVAEHRTAGVGLPLRDCRAGICTRPAAGHGEWGRKILAACAAIPFGETRTYGDMAAAAGSPKASRAAGTALGHNPVPVVVPCHRVLPAGNRSIGNYAGGVHIKEHLLQLEGVLAI